MKVGLGTGSTAYYMIQKLGNLIKQGLTIEATATSQKTEQLAQSLNIPLISPSANLTLDLTIDGADEVDPRFALIKGGGGALFREKMIASISKELIIIIHEEKYVQHLGKFPLPVEIVPFGQEITQKKINELGGNSSLRMKDGNIFETDNGNYILDCYFELINDPLNIHQSIKLLPGVVETGLFIDMATTVIVGKNDGSTEVFSAAT